MRQTLTALILGLLCQAAAGQQPAKEKPARGMTVEHARRHVRYLADDALGGRLTGTPGCRKAADYLARQFEAVGARPGMGASYLQPWALTERVALTRLVARVGKGRLSARQIRPLWCSGQGKVSGKLVYLRTATKQELATAPVKGAVALVEAIGTPDQLRARLLRVAAAGPAAILLIGRGQTRALTRSEVRSRRFLGGLLKLGSRAIFSLLPGGSKIGGLDLTVMIRRMTPTRPALDAAQRARLGKIPVLIASRRTLRRCLEKAPTPRDAVGPIPGEAAFEVALEVARTMTRNVVAVVPGSDPRLAGQVIVLGAHYDHIGSRGHSARKDGIYNGADDNASGTTALILLAEALVRKPTRRTVVLVAFSGEEYGLLGARHYAANPRPGRMVAMLNFDMIGRLTGGRLEMGGLRSSTAFAPLHQRLIKGTGFEVKLSDEMIHRSDQAEFLKKKIPALFFFTGEHAEYHEPGDHADKVNYEGMLSIVRLGLGWVRALGDADAAPAFDPRYRLPSEED